MANSDIFKLRPAQQQAFNQLAKAYKDCLKSGIFFFNNYGALTAVDKDIIAGYGDTRIHADGPEVVSEVCMHDFVSEPVNSIKIANEWADDTHYYGLTSLGHKICFND